MTRDTLLEKAQKLFKFLAAQEEPIYKSELRKLGFDGRSTDKWIELIEYIQQQPSLEVVQAGNYVTIALQRKQKQEYINPSSGLPELTAEEWDEILRKMKK